MMIEKDAAWLADQLRAQLPKADITTHKPSPKKKGTGWVIDALYRESYVVIMWTQAGGFGVSTPQDNEPYGSESDETYVNADQALERVVHLLKSGDKAGDRRVTLDELRAILGASQERLAQAMKVTQGMVSQTENRGDFLISTLQSYLNGLGFEMEVVAKNKKSRYRLNIGDPKARMKR